MFTKTNIDTIKSIIWPIHKKETYYVLSMSSLMFFILLNQNILKILKDSIIISEIGVEITNFIKIYFVMPMAALFLYSYTVMTNKIPLNKIFNILNTLFIIYFILFGFVLYPFFENFHLKNITTSNLMMQYPHFKWFIAMCGYWSLMLFYSLSELSPNIFYLVLFWQLANTISNTENAKRFYTIFALFGNSSLLVAGYIMMHFSNGYYICNLCNVEDEKYLLVQHGLMLVIISSILSSYIYNKIYKEYHKPSSNLEIRKKIKLSFRESIKYIIGSKYLWLILIGSASFGLSLNLVEAVWKSKVKLLYPTVNSYARYNAEIITWTGYTILIMTIIGNNIMRRKEWIVAALISPGLIMISGIIFFIIIMFENQISQIYLITSPLILIVIIGGIQNIISKGTKYSIWDTSREMLFIPLDSELKTKGKAAVDIISSKIGKSFSSITQHLIFIIFPLATYNNIAGILGIIFTIVCFSWIYSLKSINVQYKKLLNN